MRILLLNQYFPPDPAPTGVLLLELGDDLEGRGWSAEYIDAGQDYRQKPSGSRAVRELRALGRILWRGLWARRPDVVFSASSPPGLAMVAALIAWRHRTRAVHWLMDMYPELAVALGEIQRGALASLVRRAMGWAYRRHKLVVALDEDMAERLRDYGIDAEVIPPWILQPLQASGNKEGTPAVEGAVWMYSGNLGRAHEWETLLQAQALLEQRGSPWRLRFQGGGPSWPKAQARAEELGLRLCEWKPYVPESQLRDSLASASVLVVTQRPETQGLLWPSKLALVVDLARPMVWIGPTDGAIARSLRDLPEAGLFAPGQADEIADWLSVLARTPGRHSPLVPGREIRAAALKKWHTLLSGQCT